MNNNDWIKEHEALVRQNKDAEATSLRKEMIPDSLFRYQPLNEYTLECLEYVSIWLNGITDLNDPFECSTRVDWDRMVKDFFMNPNFQSEFRDVHKCEISDSEVQEIQNSSDPEIVYHKICLQKGLKLTDPHESDKMRRKILEDGHKEMKEKLRLCCFSERKDSILMWSHYADHHKGICIEYDFRDFNSANTFLFPVQYSNEIFDMTIPFPKGSETGNRMILASTRKALDWAYEQEWRLIFPIFKEEELKKHHFKTPIPKAIYIGYRFDKNTHYKKILLDRIVKKFQIPVQKMVLHPNEYKMIQTKQGPAN